MGVEGHCIEVKKGLKKEFHPNTFTYSKYRLSPFSACEHGCVYCDGRSEKYFVQGDFEKDIIVRKNLPELLKKETKNLREISPVSIGSGITDVYQPLEREMELMRKTGEVLNEAKLPVCILTKSSLILRDLDLWKSVNNNKSFTLFVSINTLNENISPMVEPKASSVQERLKLISVFKEAGCRVGVLCMPILPFITDDLSGIEKLVKEVKDKGADFFMPGCLTLRPGKQKKFYLDFISENFKDLLTPYKKLYSNEAGSGIPDLNYFNYIYGNIYNILKKNSLPFLPPHKLYQGLFPVYDEIYLLLHQMLDIYSYAGIDTNRLSKAVKLYDNWLTMEKKSFNRKRSLSSSYISDIMKFKLKTGEFARTIDNEKLSEFISGIVFHGKYFDPLSMKIMG